MNINYDSNFYKKFKQFVDLLMKLSYTINAKGLENLNQSDNYLLVGNHLNILDALLLMYLSDQNLRFMVDKKLYNTVIGEYFFKKLGTDSNRKNNITLKKFLELLKDKQNVVIFPEGKTHKKDIIVPFKNGIPKLSVMGGTLVVPFGIDGKYHIGSTINIKIGEPINFKNIDVPRNKWDNYLESTVRKLEKEASI